MDAELDAFWPELDEWVPELEAERLYEDLYDSEPESEEYARGVTTAQFRREAALRELIAATAEKRPVPAWVSTDLGGTISAEDWAIVMVALRVIELEESRAERIAASYGDAYRPWARARRSRAILEVASAAAARSTWSWMEYTARPPVFARAPVMTAPATGAAGQRRQRQRRVRSSRTRRQNRRRRRPQRRTRERPGRWAR
jgi:hypothetical protein